MYAVAFTTNQEGHVALIRRLSLVTVMTVTSLACALPACAAQPSPIGGIVTASASAASSSSSGNGFKWAIFGLVAALVGTVSSLVKRKADQDEEDRVTRATHQNQQDALQAAQATVEEANRRLLEADEEVRRAEEDWTYARAQFGISATEEFARLVRDAKEAVTRGFDTLSRIHATNDPEAKTTLATEIVTALETTLVPLRDAQRTFGAKRSQQAALPERIAQARERLVEEAADVDRSREELASIASIYPKKTLASLQDNPAQAAALLESARTALDRADAAADADAARAASSLDTAERALLMARQLTDAILTAKSDLDAIRERLGAAIAAVTSDLADAEHLQTDPDLFAPLIADAHEAITTAQSALITLDSPLDALERLRRVDARLNATLDPLRRTGRATHPPSHQDRR